MNRYEDQAQKYCEKHSIIIEKQKIGTKPCDIKKQGINCERNVFLVTITRIMPVKYRDSKLNTTGLREMSFQFTDSIYNFEHKQRPTNYDILACLQKDEVTQDVFEFAKEYGYEINSTKDFNRIQKIVLDLTDEYNDVRRVFVDIMDELRDIN